MLSKIAPFMILPFLLASGCGPKPLTLPDDPVERAATCGVVAAAQARSGSTAVATPLTLEQQTHILHFALLGGGEGKTFSQDRVAEIVKKMPELESGITEGKWQELVEPCRAAFPQTVVKTIELPADQNDARLSCYTLASFLATSLGQQDASLGDRLAELGAMNRKLDPKIGAAQKAKGLSEEAARDDRREALGRAARLGPPAAVMKSCLAKYGPT